MACDGSGTETQNGPDGPEVYACLGCVNCTKPGQVVSLAVDDLMRTVDSAVKELAKAMTQIADRFMAPPPKNRALRRALRYDHPMPADRKRYRRG